MTLAAFLLLLILLPLAVATIFIAGGRPASEPARNEELAARINDLLPQTQCGDCNFPDCRSYAQAIVAGLADIHQCRPGGTHTYGRLAELLTGSPLLQRPDIIEDEPPMVALIDEQHCIGCVKCIQACPVDAIIGAAKQMHTVLPRVCTGCGLCIAPCPVDCITILPAETRIKRFVWSKPRQAAGMQA